MGKRLMLMIIAVTAVIASCSKDSITNNKFSAQIGGKNWSAAVRPTTLANHIFVISGTSALGEVLIITVNGDAPDLYEFNISNLLGCNATYKKSVLSTSNDDIYTSISGKVNLTKVDKVNKKISGTFEFSLVKLSVQTLLVKNGTFTDLEYTETGI